MGTTTEIFSMSLLVYVTLTTAGAVSLSAESSVEVPAELPSITDYITGGVICSRYSQPWQAALFFENSLVCSGTLVHPQWVLTAAHCWRPSYTIALGLQRLSRPYEQSVQLIKADFSVPHPNFISAWNGTDLMLIKLSRPAVMTESVKTVPIASLRPRAGTYCLVSGWGELLDGQQPDDRQCVLLRVRSRKICKALYQELYDHSIFCAGGEGTKDSCNGDSGGPVSCRGVLHGVVSWGLSYCGRTGIPSVYTNIYMFKNWIEETIYRS